MCLSLLMHFLSLEVREVLSCQGCDRNNADPISLLTEPTGFFNTMHYLCLFKIVFQVFSQVIKVWKTLKFHTHLICLLIN